ncbi:hypothetical protein L3Q82_013573 [Scortum barcoo]|uniref:Uncharacterized protein n=1 Tax=Scortum barcoo TaxID=214431 RepID=A0ACB8W0M7_9TELE|nr:hypothetical protein L3Q82_013573 [Scortum barcoo]
MNTAHLVKKAQQRLFFLRKLKRAGFSPQLPTNFYRATIESILCLSVQQCEIVCFIYPMDIFNFKMQPRVQFPHLFTGGTPGSANKGTSREIRHPIPAELRRRPRGCKAGAKLKAELAENRRRYKPSIPSIIMGNVNSLPNKIDELSALNNQRIYRESSLFIFTETWLNHLVPDANVDLLGFTAVRVRQRH